LPDLRRDLGHHHLHLDPQGDRGLVAPAGRRDHRARARLLGGRLLRPQRRAADRLGGRVHADSRRPRHRARVPRARGPARGFELMVKEMVKFAFLAAITVLAAWIAVTGRAAYPFGMLIITAALVYAVIDLVDYELVKRKRD